MPTPQSRQRPSVPYVPSAAPFENPANLAVAATAVLGSETAEMPVTQTLVTRGPRAFGLAKHGGPRQRWANSYTTLPNQKTISLLLMPAWV